MAMFCVLLAVAAFVLTGGPQLCHCDRPHLNGVPVYRSSNGNDFDETIWSIIGRESYSDRTIPDTSARGLRRGDRMNLIPTAKVAASYAPWQGAEASSREQTVVESILNRYRKYMVDKFARFDDACSLLYAADDDTVPADADESYDSADTSLSKAPGARMDYTRFSGGEKISTAFKKEDAQRTTIKDSHPLGDLCSGNARQFYHCLSEGVNDQQLIGMIREYLQTSCYQDQDSLTSSTTLQKRDNPRYVSKQKFHSWGGKRNSAQVFYPWGGKRTQIRPHKQPKVVIRNPFHSWGGKRSDQAVDVSV